MVSLKGRYEPLTRLLKWIPRNLVEDARPCGHDADRVGAAKDLRLVHPDALDHPIGILLSHTESTGYLHDLSVVERQIKRPAGKHAGHSKITGIDAGNGPRQPHLDLVVGFYVGERGRRLHGIDVEGIRAHRTPQAGDILRVGPDRLSAVRKGRGPCSPSTPQWSDRRVRSTVDTHENLTASRSHTADARSYDIRAVIPQRSYNRKLCL